MTMTPSDLVDLVRRLVDLPRETEWVEFKSNNADPQMIGERVSALANSAALCDQAHGFLVWGISDETHQVIGTSFNPVTAKGKGNEDLESWLTHKTNPATYFHFHCFDIDGLPIVLLEIEPARTGPVSFDGTRYIRIGSYTKPLAKHPDREARLWWLFNTTPFERRSALDRVSVEQVVSLLDYPEYFHLTHTPLPENRSQVIEALQGSGLIAFSSSAGWSITNLGALLFARNLGSFPALDRKAPRVIRYRGDSRAQILRQQTGQLGYASGFERLLAYVIEQVPSEEVIEHALRTSKNDYPEVVLRELIANALIHQDFSVSGAGPTVEIFDDRIEITNPGEPLVAPDRFIDSPPQSRNEKLASSMRSLRICEELGSGWDRVVLEIELNQLPAPLITVPPGGTRVTVFSQRSLTMLDKADRVRAVYFHACVRYVSDKPMTNSSVRERFGLSKQNGATASRLLKEAVGAGMIVPYDSTVGFKSMRYVPFWADPRRGVDGKS